ncbi:MAG: hypothetical protein IMZ43_03210 [Thermoplasmata archaeon]|nr:hypothetical protein [Thermoplasmata archaeon]
MRKNPLIKTSLVCGILVLFLGMSIMPIAGFQQFSTSVSEQTTVPVVPWTKNIGTTTYEGTLSGYVTDSEMNPIGGARVRVYFHDTYRENYSDASGYYHVTDIPLCCCLKNATCSKAGYNTEWIWLSIYVNTTYDFVLTPLNGYCYPVLSGTMGENGWYVSSVVVTFVGSGNLTYYRIDGGDWTEYVVPFTIQDDGIHLFEWICNGNISQIYSETIQIDQHYPVMVVTVEKIGLNRYKFHEEVFDATSGVNRAEFYLNGYLIFADYEAPYEWTYKGPSFLPDFLSFDNAGNAVMLYIPPPQPPNHYFAIGSLKNPQFHEYYVTFSAVFVLVIERSFLSFHISTLTNQQFAIPADYQGNISDNFLVVTYQNPEYL